MPIDVESPSDTCFESFLSLIYASELASYMMRHGLSLQYAQNWLQVSAPTKLSEVDEREGDEFESKMMNLFSLKAQQQTFEFILPGKGALHDEAQFVECSLKEAVAAPFEFLAVARILLDVRLQPGIEAALAIGFTVKAGIQIEHGTAHRETRCTDDALEVFQPFRQQHQVHWH